MTSKTTAICALAVLLLGGVAAAQAYQPGEAFRLDLNQAALSPTPIGPPAQFEPVPVQAKDDAAKAEAAMPSGTKAARIAKPARAAAVKPPAHARQKVARTRSNPLDANAADTRVQVWPCRSGGICSWRK